jgi:hypothetical protein
MNTTSRVKGLFLAVFVVLPILSVQSSGSSENDAISAGSSHTMHLRNGSVRGWGSDYFGANEAFPDTSSTPAWVEGLRGIIGGISSGGSHNLFLKSDDSVWGGGSNHGGKLGTGNSYLNEYPEERHPVTPHFPALRSSHELSQRSSPGKHFSSSKPHGAGVKPPASAVFLLCSAGDWRHSDSSMQRQWCGEYPRKTKVSTAMHSPAGCPSPTRTPQKSGYSA